MCIYMCICIYICVYILAGVGMGCTFFFFYVYTIYTYPQYVTTPLTYAGLSILASVGVDMYLLVYIRVNIHLWMCLHIFNARKCIYADLVSGRWTQQFGRGGPSK